jgi:hypothetical protein
MPATIPEVDTEPMAGALLLHAPEEVTSLRAMPDPTHAADGPVIAAGDVMTDSGAATVQPAPSE